MAAPKKCHFPEKLQYTQAQARAAAASMRRKNAAWVQAYRCAGHWHVGHPLKRPGAGRRKKF